MIYLVTTSIQSGKKNSFWDFSKWHSIDHFIGELQKYQWSHYLDETWLIQTDETIEQITSKLKPYCKMFLVVKCPDDENGFAGMMPREQWDWINEKLRVS